MPAGTRLARFSCWCPKAIATIRHLPETLADRCIVIEMHRKTAQEKCERVKDLDGTELRRKCARFVADHAEEIAAGAPGDSERFERPRGGHLGAAAGVVGTGGWGMGGTSARVRVGLNGKGARAQSDGSAVF